MSYGENSNETIAAIATASGRGAIGILRISGPNAERIMSKIFSNPEKQQSHLLVHGNIIDPEKTGIIDDVMLCIHYAPHSYTGEDVVEIFAHGGDINLHLILELICRHGARLAHPGEFTRRAFLNGKMDLTRAEAVEEMISATDRKTHDLALKQMGGSFFEILMNWKKEILALAAAYEVKLQYPEERDVPAPPPDKNNMLKRIRNLLSDFEKKKREKKGLDVVIAGRTNTGKSSLFNLLVKNERVIVSGEHGTTRDTVTERVRIGDLSLVLHDTAGIKEAGSEIERKALQMAVHFVEKADLVLFVMDSSKKKTEADDLLVELIHRHKKEYILCLNKSDLPNQLDESGLERDKNEISRLHISVLTGAGVESLRDTMRDRYARQESSEISAIYSPRYESLLKGMESTLVEIGEMQERGEAIDKIAARLRDLLEYFDGFTGEKTDEEILNTVFSRFCLGK